MQWVECPGLATLVFLLKSFSLKCCGHSQRYRYDLVIEDDYQGARRRAQEEGRLLFINFTGKL